MSVAQAVGGQMTGTMTKTKTLPSMGPDEAVKFPLRRLGLVTGAVGLCLVIAASVSIWALTVQAEARSRSAAVESLATHISFEDDMLSDSARLAVVTGDRAWLTRFDNGRARLTNAVSELADTVSDDSVRDELDELRDQSTTLRALDRVALTLASEGRGDEARSLLSSDEYLAAQTAFDADVDAAVAAFEAALADEHTKADALLWVAWLFGILALTTVVIMVILVVRISRQWASAEINRLAGQLAQAEEWMGVAIERSSRGLGVIDPASAAFKYVNARLTELLAKKPHELVEPGAAAEALAETGDGREPLKALTTGNLDDYEIEHLHKSGSEGSLWLRWRLTTLSGGDGGTTNVLADVRDVTARKLREEQVKKDLLEDHDYAELVRALDEDRLVLYQQPIVEISTGATTSFELLLRMDDGHGGLRPPNTFLPIAERRGLSPVIDLWVIRRAAALAARGMPVSVNISGSSIGRPELLSGIQSAMQQPDLDPANIIFEITETAMLTGWDDVEALAKAISEIGAAVALDDFGTGHSGFAYLRHINASWIKIDMEFVQGAITDQRDRDLITAIVRLATSFGARTIGEGVEDQPTLELLKSLGVTHAQGYHLGRPSAIPSAST